MSFTYLFYSHVAFRKSCYKCHFTNTTRPSDITIADFWGWEKTDPRFNEDDKGCSLLLVNTEKGRQIMEAVKERMNTLPANLENCLQPNMVTPSPMNKNRERFENDFRRRGFKYVYYRYGNVGLVYQLRRIKQFIKKITKR